MTRGRFFRRIFGSSIWTAGVLVSGLLSVGAAQSQVSVTHTYGSLGQLTGTICNDGGGDQGLTVARPKKPKAEYLAIL